MEDVERVSRFLQRGLQAEGHNVVVAANGEDGYEAARQCDFDLVILDVMLPGISGLDVIQQLRQRGKRMPVMMLTALDSTSDKVACLRNGADDYMIKPFDFDELIARVDALLRRANGNSVAEPSCIDVAGIVINNDAKTICSGGRLIEFTAREFQLLAFFAGNPNKVLSRARILNRIWGYDSDPMTNVVDVYINRIRTKLDWPMNGPIRTIRGYGYRLNDHLIPLPL